MAYLPITPFGRTKKIVSAAIGRSTSESSEDGCVCLPADKWQLLRDLTIARRAFGLSDRDMTVLQALLSFHPRPLLDPAEALVVHPSNHSICDRANGMAASTMRRHLAKLVEAGIVTRRDSPNGKRYARRIAGETQAFGFDLRPLLALADKIATEANTARDSAIRLKVLRDTVSLLRRDLAAVAAYGLELKPDLCDWLAAIELTQDVSQALRRKLDATELDRLESTQRRLLTALTMKLDASADEMSTSNARFEHHHQKSDEETSDKKAIAQSNPTAADCGIGSDSELKSTDRNVAPPLGLVLEACKEIASYSTEPIRGWRELIATAERVRPMTGISSSAWNEAKTAMGNCSAAVVLAAILERFRDIRSPGGYLRALTAKAQVGTFSASSILRGVSTRTVQSSQL